VQNITYFIFCSALLFISFSCSVSIQLHHFVTTYVAVDLNVELVLMQYIRAIRN